jgi:hypothetical protein
MICRLQYGLDVESLMSLLSFDVFLCRNYFSDLIFGSSEADENGVESVDNPSTSGRKNKVSSQNKCADA